MTIIRASLIALATVSLLVACGSSDSSEPTDSTNEDLKKHHCVDNVLCAIDEHFDTKTCKCEPNSTGAKCGTKTCGSGEYCCSESCGICEKIGAMCPAIACAN